MIQPTRKDQARGAPVDARGRGARSSDALLESLSAEAAGHVAVSHPYLQRIADGSLPDPEGALQDLVVAYEGYSEWFPRFLTALERRLPEGMRHVLAENLSEEAGAYDEPTLAELEEIGVRREWVVGIPHPQLFRRMRDAILTAESRDQDRQAPLAAVERWRSGLLDLMTEGHPGVAVGALGLGTELVVSRMYDRVLRGVRRLGTVAPRDHVFLTLHALVDDAHAASMLSLAQAFAGDDEGCQALAHGMREALQLRAVFWDEMLEIALAPRGETR